MRFLPDDPETLLKGFVMKLAVYPCCIAVSFTNCLYRKALSGDCRPCSGLNVSSTCAGPNSAWKCSGFMPMLIMFRIIALDKAEMNRIIDYGFL